MHCSTPRLSTAAAAPATTLALGATVGIGPRRVDEALASVGLTELAHKSAGSYSLGMGQRLGAAAAGSSFFTAYGLAWMAVSMVLPRATPGPGALLAGSALVGATIAGSQTVIQLYLTDRLGRASELYGAIGATIVTLGWFFIAGRAIVLAKAINAVVDERFGSISRRGPSSPRPAGTPARYFDGRPLGRCRSNMYLLL